MKSLLENFSSFEIWVIEIQLNIYLYKLNHIICYKLFFSRLLDISIYYENINTMQICKKHRNRNYIKVLYETSYNNHIIKKKEKK